MQTSYSFVSSINLSNNPLNEAAQKLNSIFAHVGHKPVLFLVSGGSSLQLLDHIKLQDVPPQLTIAPLDERYSSDPTENNMAQIMSTTFYTSLKEAVKWIDTRVRANETQSMLATRFNQELQNWLAQNPDGEIIATIGIGPDGHVSGMMPYPENPKLFETLFMPSNSAELVTAYDAQQKNQYPLRVTTNMHLLRKINHSVIFAAGNNKREALARLVSDTGTLAETPARILREMSNTHLYTDITV